MSSNERQLSILFKEIIIYLEPIQCMPLYLESMVYIQLIDMKNTILLGAHMGDWRC
jgi:hypothetical protein